MTLSNSPEIATQCRSKETFQYKEYDIERGKRIIDAMRRRGFQYNCEVCYDIGVSESTVSRWRAGRPLILRHAVALCKVLDISLDYLLTGETDHEPKSGATADLAEFCEVFGELDPKLRPMAMKLLQSLYSKSSSVMAEPNGKVLKVELADRYDEMTCEPSPVQLIMTS